MKFLSLLLGLVILVAILYQSVFTPTINNKSNTEIKAKTSQAFQAIKDAEELKQMINSKNKNMNYEEALKKQ